MSSTAGSSLTACGDDQAAVEELPSPSAHSQSESSLYKEKDFLRRFSSMALVGARLTTLTVDPSLFIGKGSV
eukprot:CAMPEP_0170622124 /NCGR_PEP_ID=MMETSP0224-20130122/28960_1 /TAXON_ID=285029 /ORGANISM="Togula jolla, Strain CCCM 725" /LENGTH=71 /DNA_ID=CAMNT_0010948415 /DNA_START=1040 /DNA_END=1255 /DNA_ORIENTATION=+